MSVLSATMSSVQNLREFIRERLTAAAEEIFSEFERTIVQYEEELDCQRRLLALCWKPQVKLHRVELQQQSFSKKEDVCVDQELPEIQQDTDEEEREPPQIIENQEEEPESPQIKEEPEETEVLQFIENQEKQQKGQQLVLKQETDAFMETHTHHESESEPNSVQLYSQNPPVAESQDQEGNNSVFINPSFPPSVFPPRLVLFSIKKDFCLPPAPHELKVGSTPDKPPAVLHRAKTDTSVKCDICEKFFSSAYSLKRHHRVHSGERPYTCKTCGKGYTQSHHLKVHMRSHTGAIPYVCKTCGKEFSYKISLNDHMKTHKTFKMHFCGPFGKNLT